MSPGKIKGLPGLEDKKYIIATQITQIIRNIFPELSLSTTFTCCILMNKLRAKAPGILSLAINFVNRENLLCPKQKCRGFKQGSNKLMIS